MGKAPVKRILAVRKFTDRTEPKEAFNRIFNDAQRNTDEFNVISYYGIGGFGKTRLINEINRLLDRYNGEHSDLKKIVHVTYDFAHGTDKMYVLDKLRNLLKKQGLSFPLSDALNITYNIKCGNPVYKTVSEKDLLDDPMISIAAKFIPGASSILSTVKTGKTIMEETGKYYKKMQKIWNLDEKKLDEEISAIGKLQVNELEDQASFYFARDLCRNTENAADEFRLPLVICLDTYEELVNSYAAYGYANAYDIWLRDDIIRTVPGVLWVIGGRERLRWDEYDDFWQGAIEEHELGDLNEADSLDFLRTAGIPEQFLQPIYKISGGTPLFLDLSVTTYYEQLAAGKTITEESFGSSREQVIERFLRYMDNDDQNVARVLAVLQSWTDDEAYAVCKQVLPVFYEECYENFIKHTIIVKDSDVRYYMHEQVRKVIADDTRKNNLRLLERTVAAKMEYYRELPWDSYENSEYMKVLEDATVIMSRGDLSRDDFDGAYQWMADKLERVYSLSMYQTVYRMFTNIQRGLPANSEKKYIILYQLALTGIQCNHTEDVLEHLKTGMRELKEVASRRYLYLNYCLLYGLALKNLKRYEPAKEVFREVYGQAAAQSPPFTGHMATAVSNLAYIYRTLGDNDKAIEHTRWAAELRKKDDTENRIIDLYNLAQSYQNKGEREKARQYLEDAYSQAMESLGPHHIRTLTVMEALGRDHLARDEWKEALDIYVQVWQEKKTMDEQNGTHITAIFAGIAEACQQLKQPLPPEVRDYLEEQLEKEDADRRQQDIMSYMASACYKFGWKKEGLKLAETACRCLKKQGFILEAADYLPLPMVHLAWMYYMEERNQEAVALYDVLIRKAREILGPTDATVLLYLKRLAYCNFHLQNFAVAAEQYEEICRIIVLDEKEKVWLAYYHNQEGMCRFWNRQLDKARECYQTSLAISQKSPSDKDTKPEILYSAIADCYTFAGRYQEAYPWQLKAVEQAAGDPRLAALLADLAYGCAMTGKKEESYKYYCEAYENRDSWLKDRQPGTIASIEKTAAEFGWQEEVHQKALAILEKAVAITEEYAGPESEMAVFWRQVLQTRKDLK